MAKFKDTRITRGLASNINKLEALDGVAKVIYQKFAKKYPGKSGIEIPPQTDGYRNTGTIYAVLHDKRANGSLPVRIKLTNGHYDTVFGEVRSLVKPKKTRQKPTNVEDGVITYYLDSLLLLCDPLEIQREENVELNSAHEPGIYGVTRNNGHFKAYVVGQAPYIGRNVTLMPGPDKAGELEDVLRYHNELIDSQNG